MKINIIGWYDKNNCGDESFKYVFNDIFKNNEIFYTTQEIIPDCDHYILGGGDVVKNFYLKSIPNDKKLMCLGVGLGYEDESLLLKEKNISKVYTRNKEDVEIFKSIDIESKYTPDVVFYLEKPNEIKEKLESDLPKIGILLTDNVNPNVVNRNSKEFNYNEFFKWELAESLETLSKNYKIYFIALSEHYYSYDEKMNLDIQTRMENGHKTTLLKETKCPLRTMDLIQQMDIIITMKYHGIIFSTICNIPFINIGLSRKTNKFCEESNLTELSFTPNTFNKNDLLKKIKYIEDNTDEIKIKLSAIDKSNKEDIKNNIKEWIEEIK
jgi:polysaccharide pyruvyl transferase WcaK-like protein